jgi:hypothetical protein
MNRANRPRLSRISGSSYASKLMSRAGDGSTLTLDFTTGVLDPRLTFERLSSATFINSSGFVQYANHNLFRNTAWLTSTTPTAWNVTFGTGTTTWNNDGSVTMTAGGSSVRPCINHQTTTVSQGLPMTFGYRATNVTGSPQIFQVIESNNVGQTFAINGVTVASSAVVTSGDVVSCTFTPASGSVAVRIGPGSPVAVTNMSVTASRPQWNYGTTLQQYQQNTSTTAELQSPRFDYDPVTNAAKGLLIEGASTNLIRHSSAPQSWSGAVSGTTITSGSGFAPDNVSTPRQLAMTSGGFCYQLTSTTNVAGTYTYSVWLKASSNQSVGIRVCRTSDGSVKGMITASVTTQWQRFEVQVTTNATDQIDCGFDQRNIPPSVPGPGVAATFLMWNAQLEAGAGASSAIPTGASAVTRTADFCAMTGTNFSSWYQGGTQGTFYADWFGGVRTGASGSTNRTVLSTDDVANKHLHLMQTAAAGNLRLRDFGGANQITTANTLTSGARTKGAFGYNGSSASVCLNGGTVATGSSLAFSVAPTWLVIGATSTNGTSLTDANVVLNNSIRQIKYWPTRLADGTLQGLTT